MSYMYLLRQSPSHWVVICSIVGEGVTGVMVKLGMESGGCVMKFDH